MARSKIESVLTALPVLMLVGGLYVFYSGEIKQLDSKPILSEAVKISGDFKGFSELKSGGEGQRFIWLLEGDKTRGARLTSVQLEHLRALDSPLVRGADISITMAPTVEGSRTRWLIQVIRENKELM